LYFTINRFSPVPVDEETISNHFKKLLIDSTTNKPVKDSLGRLVYIKQTAEELSKRKNYRTADNRNYNDGDLKSRINEDHSWKGIDKNGSTDMYYKHNNEITSLVSDVARVYKGGSWKDRIYWLSPGSRRFLNEKRATDDIGFRCAMSHVGKYPKYKKHK